MLNPQCSDGLLNSSWMQGAVCQTIEAERCNGTVQARALPGTAIMRVRVSAMIQYRVGMPRLCSSTYSNTFPARLQSTAACSFYPSHSQRPIVEPTRSLEVRACLWRRPTAGQSRRVDNASDSRIAYRSRIAGRALTPSDTMHGLRSRRLVSTLLKRAVRPGWSETGPRNSGRNLGLLTSANVV